MKKVVLFILICLKSYNIYSQDTYGKIESNKYVWQKVFDSKFDTSETKKLLLLNIKALDVKDFGDRISFGQEGIPYDYKGAGFTTSMCPIFIQTYTMSYNVRIDFKKNRYRVTVTNILLKNQLDLNLDNTILSGEVEVYPVETFYLKKRNTMFRKTYINTTGRITDYTFSSIFELKKIDDNW